MFARMQTLLKEQMKNQLFDNMYMYCWEVIKSLKLLHRDCRIDVSKKPFIRVGYAQRIGKIAFSHRSQIPFIKAMQVKRIAVQTCNY